jgi:arginine/lysine/ornithine decarboxylase
VWRCGYQREGGKALNIKTPIVDGLNKYLSENHKPWHMPGHKRKSRVCDVSEDTASKASVAEKNNMVENIIRRVQAMDVTEVPGLDDLHCPEGMIRESEEQLKGIYGTAASFYLVNGSTCGIFAAIAACGRGGIIAADNCHKSVRNAAELMGISISYVKTEKIYLNERCQLRGYVSPEELEKICKTHKNATAVVITSPTYEGIISNIKAISRVTEKYGMYLLVDEAHGAHLPFMTLKNKQACQTVTGEENFSAIYNGADVVIQSLHKTLVSLTQTAILHITDKAVEKNPHIREDMRRILSFVMSSSPSYVLLASMELAVTDAAKAAVMDAVKTVVEDEKYGHIVPENPNEIVNTGNTDNSRKNIFEEYVKSLKNFRKKCEELENLRVFAGGDGYDIDITRLVIYQTYLSEMTEKQGNRLTGPELEKMLAEENIVVEMSGLDYVVLISSYVDNEADFVDLYAALQKIDGKIGKKLEEITMEEYGNIQVTLNVSNHNLKSGDISPADFYVYPPGIPIIAKGQIITDEALSELRALSSSGKKIHIS